MQDKITERTVETTLAEFINKSEILVRLKISLIALQRYIEISQSKDSIITGRNINSAATIPKAPTDDFKSLTQLWTVVKASLMAPPTTGTKLLIINLAAFEPILSEEAPTMPCKVNKLTNVVIDKESVHLIAL
jgi:hypothetical protein